MTKTVSTNKARQGRRGWPILVVLIAGLVLAFAAWGAVEIYGVSIEQPQQQMPKG